MANVITPIKTCTTNYSIPFGVPIDRKEQMNASLNLLARQFIIEANNIGADIKGLRRESDSDKNSNQCDDEKKIINDSIEWLEESVPKDKVKIYTGNGGKPLVLPGQEDPCNEVTLLKPSYEIDKGTYSDWQELLKLQALMCESETETFIKNNLNLIDKNKFLKAIDYLFDKMYIPEKGQELQAKTFFTHMMINTKRLLCGMSDSWQQLLTIWSECKGTGKDYLIRSLAYALTDKQIVSHSLNDLVRNFNSDLVKARGIFYVEEKSAVDAKCKNDLKKMITNDKFPVEFKGKDVFEAKRKFTILMSANEDPSSIFYDENKERRNASIKIVGSNYHYKTNKKTVSDDTVLWPFFKAMWLWCPIEYFYEPELTKILAEKDSPVNLARNTEIVDFLRKMGNREIQDNMRSEEVDAITTANQIITGKRFSEKQLRRVLKFDNATAPWEISRFIGSSFCQAQANQKYVLDFVAINSTPVSTVVKKSYSVPTVKINVDAIVTAISKGYEYDFPTPKFKTKIDEDNSMAELESIFNVKPSEIKTETQPEIKDDWT